MSRFVRRGVLFATLSAGLATTAAAIGTRRQSRGSNFAKARRWCWPVWRASPGIVRDILIGDPNVYLRTTGPIGDALSRRIVSLGFGVALIVGIGVCLNDVGSSCNTFWRSQPINPDLWFWSEVSSREYWCAFCCVVYPAARRRVASCIRIQVEYLVSSDHRNGHACHTHRDLRRGGGDDLPGSACGLRRDSEHPVAVSGQLFGVAYGS